MSAAHKDSGSLFIVSGSSVVGKTTLVREAIKRLNAQHPHYHLEQVITYTARVPREGEIPGGDYHFISPEEFKKRAENNEFFETTSYGDVPYASPRSLLQNLQQGASQIIVVDRSGAQQINNAVDGAILIWITAPGIEEIKRRLEKRGGLTPNALNTRLELAQNELDEENKKRFFTYHIVNEAFERAVSELMLIIKKELENS